MLAVADDNFWERDDLIEDTADRADDKDDADEEDAEDPEEEAELDTEDADEDPDDPDDPDNDDDDDDDPLTLLAEQKSLPCCRWINSDSNLRNRQQNLLGNGRNNTNNLKSTP